MAEQFNILQALEQIYEEKGIQKNIIIEAIEAGKKVTVKYDAQLTNRPLTVFLDNQFICEARILDSYANTKVSRNIQSEKKHSTEHSHKKDESSKSQINHSLTAAEIEL